MIRAKKLTLRWLLSIAVLMTASLITAAASFVPSISMLGVASQVSVGEQIEWLVTFSNIGDAAGQNIVLSNTVGAGLQVDNVNINTGTTSINGRTVTVSIPVLEPNQTVQFSVFTTITANSDLSNTACVTASNVNEETCVRGLPIQSLPNTGEAPQWRQPMIWLSMLTISISVLMIGMGLWTWQHFSLEVEEET